ncbi:MAG: hypothetical protein ACLRP8_10575 [Roseburia intestinalis]
MDEKYYEHELDLKNYDLDSGYMLGINEDVLKVRHEKDKIIMTSAERILSGLGGTYLLSLERQIQVPMGISAKC